MLSPSNRRRCVAIMLAMAAIVTNTACGTHTIDEQNVRLFQLHSRLAQEGSQKSALVLGSVYLKGIGVDADFEKAVYWYERAGPVGGWTLAGTSFQYRNPPDYRRAAEYYRKAAEICSPLALYELGALQADRHLDDSDDVSAYASILLARWAASHARGCLQHVSCVTLALEDRRGYLASLKHRLTREQVSDAEARAEAWRRAHPWPRGAARCRPDQ